MASSRAAAAREGGGEAWVGVVQAEGSSREIPKKSGVPTLSTYAEGLVVGGVSASRWGTPRGHSPWCMYEALHAENREALDARARGVGWLRSTGEPVEQGRFGGCGDGGGKAASQGERGQRTTSRTQCRIGRVK